MQAMVSVYVQYMELFAELVAGQFEEHVFQRRPADVHLLHLHGAGASQSEQCVQRRLRSRT